MLEMSLKKKDSLQIPNLLKAGDREEDIRRDQTLNKKIAPTDKKEIIDPTETNLAIGHQARNPS